MYDRDVNLIIDHCNRKASVLPVVTFTLCTIQAGLSTCGDQIADVNQHGADSRFMWGKKGDGYSYAAEHDAYLWGKVNRIKDTLGTESVEACVEAILLFMKIPNLGMVKAAFCAQMFGFDVACIDSHNIKRLGLPASAVKTPPAKMKPATVRKKVAAYVALTQDTGGSRYWWDSWCAYVAGNRANKRLVTADAVSVYHVTCVESVSTY